MIYQGPEVLFLVFLQGSADSPTACVVGGPGEMPVAKAAVQFLEEAGGGSGGGDEVTSLVEPEVLPEFVGSACGGDKLPNARCAGGAGGAGDEAALDHRKVDGVCGEALLFEDGEHDGDIASGGGHPFPEKRAARAGEKVDIGFNQRMIFEGNVELRGEVGRKVVLSLVVGEAALDGDLLKALEEVRLPELKGDIIERSKHLALSTWGVGEAA